MKMTIDMDASKLKLPLAEYREKMDYIIIKRLKAIGESSVKVARDLGAEYKLLSPSELERLRHVPHQPNYIDKWGNLRQSIGYLVAKDGIIQSEDLRNQQAEELAYGVLTSHPVGYCLILVAGMEYAAEVSGRGYDVLDSAAINARQKFMDYCKKMFKK